MSDDATVSGADSVVAHLRGVGAAVRARVEESIGRLNLRLQREAVAGALPAGLSAGLPKAGAAALRPVKAGWKKSLKAAAFSPVQGPAGGAGEADRLLPEVMAELEKAVAEGILQ